MNSRYMRCLQAIPVVSLVFGIGCVCGTILLLWRIKAQSTMPDYPLVLTSADILLFGGVGTVLTYFFLQIARATWFFLYSYHLTEIDLEIAFPISGKVLSIRLEEVQQIKSFFVHGPPPASAAARGHILVAPSFPQIHLSEALPLWPEIAKRCVSVRLEEPVKPWRQPL